MATHGSGNFQNDGAADYIADFVTKHFLDPIREGMQDPLRLEPDEWDGVVVPCMIEVLAAIAQVRHGLLPDPAEITAWKRTYLEVWDRAQAEPWPERRAVLVKTFDKLARIAKKQKEELES